MSEETVAGLLRGRAGDGHPALFFEDECYSWAEFVDAAGQRAQMALALRREGPFHIGILLDNVPEFLFWIAGSALAGAAAVGINPTRRGGELAHDIRHTDCQLIVTDGAHLPLLEGLDTGVEPGRTLLIDTPTYAESVAAHAGDGLPEVEIHPADHLLLLFTSGSTGAPKAVICSQRRLAAIATVTPDKFGISRDTVTYQSMPLFHGNALMANWAPVLGRGATMAMARRFSATGFLPDVRRFGASFFNYVGRSLAYVLATPEAADDADNPLRLGFGTEASARDMEAFTRRFGCELLENYGSSEGAINTEKPAGAPANSIGMPRPGTDVAIVDPVTRRECPPARFDAEGGLVNGHEAIGEIVGRNVVGSFEGYYNNAEAEAERIRHGWYWSGDLGYRDEDGWFYFAGRGGDWLRVDSENFAAAPLERILSHYPTAVMVAVYPVPDARTGDQVMVAMELEPGSSFDPVGFHDFLTRQPDLGTKWMPRFVRIVPEMPLTASNKVQKQPLRTERWETSDPVYWQPRRGGPYEPLAAAQVADLRAEFR
ncbi:MAG TPA: AMP-binding protein, partial [Acidimicrobiales bacterium]|nr:AMP-binding protein [Acidimicrobiales bacterium]